MSSSNIGFKPNRPGIFFQLAYDYVPKAILVWPRYIPFAPFKHLRALHDIYRVYGKQIVREKKSSVDAEGQKTGKDVMSLLSKYGVLDNV